MDQNPRRTSEVAQDDEIYVGGDKGRKQEEEGNPAKQRGARHVRRGVRSEEQEQFPMLNGVGQRLAQAVHVI